MGVAKAGCVFVPLRKVRHLQMGDGEKRAKTVLMEVHTNKHVELVRCDKPHAHWSLEPDALQNVHPWLAVGLSILGSTTLTFSALLFSQMYQIKKFQEKLLK